MDMIETRFLKLDKSQKIPESFGLVSWPSWRTYPSPLGALVANGEAGSEN